MKVALSEDMFMFGGITLSSERKEKRCREIILIILIHVPCIFIICYYNQLMHNYFIEVYITTAFCVIYIPTCFDIFVSASVTTNALLIYTRPSNCSCW
jgi:hypothetical protein